MALHSLGPYRRQIHVIMMAHTAYPAFLAATVSARVTRVFGGLLSRCGSRRDEPSVPASVFGQLNASQRGTFVAITHAMLNTSLVDREQGKELGDAFQLIEELRDIQGENLELPSDHQFQLIVRLAPGALQKLERSADFARGGDHVFHKAYPISFRQFRPIRSHGREPGLHISLAPDRRLAEIHIDYRFCSL